MNTRFPSTIRAILVLALLGGGTGLVSTTVAGQVPGAGPLLTAARQAGSRLHAEYGHFGAIGALFGERLRIPVSSTTCEPGTSDGSDCAGRG